MTRSSGGIPSEALRRRIRRNRIVAWVALACIVVFVFEFALYLTATLLFTHVDTPDCAGSDTFCSPDGRPGLTGGAVVVTVGNLAALVIVAVAVFLLKWGRSRHSRS